jgi:uncharacterized membrane protein
MHVAASVLGRLANRKVSLSSLEIMVESNRNEPLLNGALIALGALAIVDNVVAHWLLGLHRAIPGPHALPAEIGLIVLGAGLLGPGIWWEARARRRL